VPTMWLWVNTHGSFPLGLVAVGLLAIGRRLDHESSAVEVRTLKWAALGTLAGAVNPVGPRLLVFPVELLRRQDVLSNVIEWQAPKFVHIGQRAFLLVLLLAVIALVRRPSWRAGLPVIVFTAASLLGSRNIVVASIVFIPGLARGLRGLGTVTGEERRSIYRPIAAALVVVGLLFTLGEKLPIRLGRLPGDIAIRGKNSVFYFPVVTCILLSVVLSLVMSLFGRR